MKNDGYKMPERTRRMLYDLVPTISFVTTFLVIFGAPEGGSFYERLEKFDGLIAGALAIFAAYVTVRAMRESDDKQEKRHRREMALATRHDNAKVLRLVAAVPSHLRQTAVAIDRFAAALPAGQLEPEWNAENRANAGYAVYQTKQISGLLGKSTIVDCEPLFSPAVAFHLQTVQSWLSVIDQIAPLGRSGLVELFTVPNNSRPDWFQLELVPPLLDLAQMLLEFADELERWANDMLADTALDDTR